MLGMIYGNVESIRMNTFVLIVLFYICAKCSAQDAQNKVKGTMDFLNGINEVLEAAGILKNPWPIIFGRSQKAEKAELISEATPKLEQLYDEFFNTNSTTTQSSNESTTTIVKATENPIATQENSTIKYFTQSDNPWNIDAPTDPYQTTEPMNRRSGFNNTVSSSEMQNTTMLFYNSTGVNYDNSTFDYMLKMQSQLCYKLKDGIGSLSEYELVVLLTKFLKYDYLVAQEAWQRLAITTEHIWEAAIREDDNQTYGSRKVTQFLNFLNNVKEDVKFCLNILKVPFSIMMRGISNKFKSLQGGDQNEARDFCMQINEAERNIRDAILRYEDKFSKTLDVKIKEETELLEAAKNDPEIMSLVNKETISKDLFNVKDNIYKIYDYIRNATSAQLNKLMGLFKVEEVNKVHYFKGVGI